MKGSDSASIELGETRATTELPGPRPDAGAPPVTVDPDGSLVERAVRGERDAFETLLRRHYDRIHRIAWRLTGSSSHADDIAQDVCCTLVENIGSFKGEAKFTTWLTRIVVNACRDQRRRGVAFTRLRDCLSVLAGLAPWPDGRDAIDAAGSRASLHGSIRCCAIPSFWLSGRT